MKPLNHNSDSCDPISSNCVQWQGPDIQCIKLCKGDTVSAVVAKLGTELYSIMTTLDITSYDLSCFNLTSCAPTDFEKLIQFLIGRICKLEQCTGCIPSCSGEDTPPLPTTTSSGCPDCMVTVAPCFNYLNQFGDTVTTRQLVDYVHAIGNKVCLLVGQIDTINTTLGNLVITVNELNTRAPLVFTLPEFIPVCVLQPVSTDIATILQALEQQFCALRSATGTPDQIYQAITKQCAGLITAPTLGPGGGTMGSIPGWVNNPTNAADTITNLWLTICDMRSAISSIKVNCCPDGCDEVTIDLQLTLVGTILKLYFTGNIPAGFIHCNPLGIMFTLTDTSGGLVNVFVDVIGNMNNLSGYSIDLSVTPLNLSNNITVTGSPCFQNDITNTTCQSYLQKTQYNIITCPPLILTPVLTSIFFNTTVGTGTADYTFEVWDSTGITLIASTTQTIIGPGSFTGSISGLSQGTLYKVRLVITIGGISTYCSFQSTTTLGGPCLPPVLSTVSISIGGIPVSGPYISLNRVCDFAVLTGESFTTVDLTTINGNFGITPGTSITGTPTIRGFTHINDTAAINAKVDLTAAYISAASAVATTDMSGIDLGGLTLTPGVYFFSSSAAITGVLTLNGAGSYIFQIGTTLTTDGGPDVVLTNGATPDNVIWQVGSSATLGTNSRFKGILMALSSITIDGGVIYGAVLARNGSVTFTGGTVVNYAACPILT